MKVRNGIVFTGIYPIVKQENEQGETRFFKTNRWELAGATIPETVTDVERYAKEYVKLQETASGIEHSQDDLIYLREVPKESDTYNEMLRFDALKQEKDEGGILIENGPQLIGASVKANVNEPVEIIEASPQNMLGANIANFSVEPLRRYVWVDRTGKEQGDKELFECLIIINNASPQPFSIQKIDLSKLVSKIKRKFAAANVNFEIPNVEKIIEADFRRKTPSVLTITCLQDYGWQQLNGHWICVTDNLDLGTQIEIETGVQLPFYNCSPNEAGQIYLKSLRLYKEKETMATLSLFSLTGLLFKLFEQAGYKPRFLLFVYGKTGGFKTTISKLLFTQITDEQHRDTPRRIDADTVTSFERGIVLNGRDTVTLIDDYAPAKGKVHERELAAKLEALVRMVGDSSTKSRSSAKLEDRRGEGVGGTVVLTGELKGKGLSSNLRCLYVRMEKSFVDINEVTWFQENKDAYTTFLHHFAAYLGERWEAVKEYISRHFSEERRGLQAHLCEFRLIDSCAVLRIAADILGGFLIQYCGFKEEDIDQMVEKMKEAVLFNTQYSQSISTTEQPSIKFVRAIQDLMNMKRIVLSESKAELAKKFDYFDGFFDDDYFYFYLPAIFKKVTEFLEQTRQFWAFTMAETATLLYEDGILVPSKNGRGLNGNPCSLKYHRIDLGQIDIKTGHKHRIDFLKIRRNIFYKIADGYEPEKFKMGE